MASGIYPRFFANLMNKVVDMEADTIKVALMATGHAFNSAHAVFGDVTANDIGSKVVYVAGGSALAGKAVTQGTTTKWAATNHAYGPGETLSAYHIVLWNDLAGSDELICSIDLGGVQTCTNGTFTIEWNASGILTLTSA